MAAAVPTERCTTSAPITKTSTAETTSAAKRGILGPMTGSRPTPRAIAFRMNQTTIASTIGTSTPEAR